MCANKFPKNWFEIFGGHAVFYDLYLLNNYINVKSIKLITNKLAISKIL